MLNALRDGSLWSIWRGLTLFCDWNKVTVVVPWMYSATFSDFIFCPPEGIVASISSYTIYPFCMRSENVCSLKSHTWLNRKWVLLEWNLQIWLWLAAFGFFPPQFNVIQSSVCLQLSWSVSLLFLTLKPWASWTSIFPLFTSPSF